MHVRVRFSGHPEAIVVVASKLTKIQQFRNVLRDKFKVPPKLQRLIYGGKLLEDGYTFHDYNIKLNDVIQLMQKEIPISNKNGKHRSPKNFEYKDAISSLYEVRDLIDAKQTGGYWMEATITKIVIIPVVFNDDKSAKESGKDCEKNILFKVKLNQDVEEETYCKLSEIRPRARNQIDPEQLKAGQVVMVNYNIEDPGDTGNWYDFKVDEIIKNRKRYKLIGTLYLGSESVTQSNITIPVKDKIFAIEEPVPLAKRSEKYIRTAAVIPQKRSQPLNCKKCGDDGNKPCKYCGCSICASKESPGQIILCDECDDGFHLNCLSPPLSAVPDEDWYCQACKRDPNDVIAPGAAKQVKKTTGNERTRDWGRGMACVGKTKNSAMPPDHFGPIPGMEVGMVWRYRMQLSETGLHRPSVSGIHGRDIIGAFSIVLSGGYEDDVDNGIEFTYTGSGGRDLSGNKRTAEQSCDQKFTRENRALARNCAANSVSEDGGNAGAKWRQGKPVRVMRSYKMRKAFPKYAPLEGIRYDGIYKVVKYYPEQGKSGFRVYKYLLRRDDPSPAPWEAGAKQFSIVYPDGYLEAQAEKLKLKQKKTKPKVAKKSTPEKFTLNLRGKTTKSTRNTRSSANENKQTSNKANSENKKRATSSSDTAQSSEESFNDSQKSNTINTKRNSTKADCKTPEAPPVEKKSPSKCTVKLGFAKDDSLKQNNTNGRQLRKRKISPNDKTSQTKLTFSPVAKKVKKSLDSSSEEDKKLTVIEKKSIEADKLNTKLWIECLEIFQQKSKAEFIEHVTETFRCIICQGLAVVPVTTPCLHNFCSSCMKRAFKITEQKSCPYCRQKLTDTELATNEHLMKALRTILPGYDAGQK